MLGRKHDSVLETIKSNRHQRAFKYGNFITRPYSTGAAHGYEFLITRKGLDALAGVMRYNAKDRIAEAYAGAWDASPAKRALPAAESTTPAAPEADEASETIRELARWIDELRADLRKARTTARTYARMYEDEKRQRELGGRTSGLWHDLYEDLLWRLLHEADAPLDDRMAAHRAFRDRISSKSAK